MQNDFWKASHKKTIMASVCRYSWAVSGKILVHKRYQRLTSALKETVLEPTLKPCMQTRCRKGGRDLRIKVFEVMESMKAKEEVPQHLQLVLVVRFYQKLQSLLAVPEKRNQKKKKWISISVLCSNLTGGYCFQFKCNFPFHSSQVSAVGSPVELTYPQIAPTWFQNSAQRSCPLGPTVVFQWENIRENTHCQRPWLSSHWNPWPKILPSCFFFSLI